MSSFEVYPGGKRTPVVSVDTIEYADEPVFVALHSDGGIQVLDLSIIREWAEDLRTGDVEAKDLCAELYVRLPGSTSLLTCAIGFAGSAVNPKVTILGVASTSGVLYTVDL